MRSDEVAYQQKIKRCSVGLLWTMFLAREFNPQKNTLLVCCHIGPRALQEVTETGDVIGEMCVNQKGETSMAFHTTSSEPEGIAMDDSGSIYIVWRTESFLSLYVDKIMKTVWQALLFLLLTCLTQNNTNQAEHEFDIASRRTLFFQHRAFRDAGSDLRYGFRPLPLYAYVARHDGGRRVFL
ncbi:SdiA-regulated domain-containing protein [Escherichia coli]|nr:SdiA-regulated domain-containing protein [Escherichia coli]